MGCRERAYPKSSQMQIAAKPPKVKRVWFVHGTACAWNPGMINCLCTSLSIVCCLSTEQNNTLGSMWVVFAPIFLILVPPSNPRVRCSTTRPMGWTPKRGRCLVGTRMLPSVRRWITINCTVEGVKDMPAQPEIIYTKVDEAPELASASFLLLSRLLPNQPVFTSARRYFACRRVVSGRHNAMQSYSVDRAQDNRKEWPGGPECFRRRSAAIRR